MTTNIRLPTKQKAIFEALRGAGDVPFDVLFQAIDGPEHYRSNRQQQRWLGSYLTRLNRSLRDHGMVVQPGDLKRTYRLNVV
jgi:hypothetical protein